MGRVDLITERVIGCAMTVHTRLGPGLLESAYQKCVEYELLKAGLRVEYEKPIPLVYDELSLECGYRIDLLVAGQVIVEVKAKETFHPVDYAQLLSYLRLLDLQVGLLINFHSVRLKDGVKRLVNNYHE
jgi:GxxExxY protein